jgi:crotonobetainyl-CoA:carnitine CoA-transferase CaiB-like acyl-CoA transferase
MGEPPWSTEQRFADSLGRWHHHKELDDLIGEWTGRMDIWEVTDLLQRHAVPAGPVLDEALAFSDPHLQARRYWVDIEHQEAGTHPYPGFLWRMSATPPMVRKPSPCLGEHNDYVYRELLGLSRQEIDQLEKEGHIGYDYVC